MQEAPHIEPELSSGAMKLRRKKLGRIPWDHSGKHPGSRTFWKAILIMIGVGVSYVFRSRQYDRVPEFEGGRVLSAIHLNGLIDPTMMIHSRDRRVISMGRHDLMTMPLIGWFSRRMGSQPVIRKAEIENGVSDEEYAREINDRTLLTMTNCIASGHNALVMPEGKSHQDAHLHRFKTGPMRFALNASSIARHKGLPAPALQPIGLHFRCHYWFRTDVFVEYEEPIPVHAPEVPGAGARLSSGEWEEPPAELVNHLREQLFEALSKITPNAPDWKTYRAWHLIGHVRANSSSSPLRSYREEVLAARSVRDSLSASEDTQALLSPAIQAAEILHERDLDSRSLLKPKRGRRWAKAALGVFLMALAAPISLPSTGAQALLAWYFGDRTDEGIDARTTYHYLAGMLSPAICWPIFATLASLAVHPLSVQTIPIALAFFPVFHVSNLVFLLGYDFWTDFSTSSRESKLESSEAGIRLNELVEEVRANLNVL
tara:strand:- start:96 stop:1556 length:1461 start_codon:yes stop_codon:yes gene_type:complete